MNDRQYRRRLRDGLCFWHNTPLARMQTADASRCSLGCVYPHVPLTVRKAHDLQPKAFR